MLYISIQTPTLQRIADILHIAPAQVTFVSYAKTHFVVMYDDVHMNSHHVNVKYSAL